MAATLSAARGKLMGDAYAERLQLERGGFNPCFNGFLSLSPFRVNVIKK